MSTDIYAKDRAKIAAVDWAGLHVRSDRSPAVQLGRLMRRFTLGHGVRKERGGFRVEERP